jgi:hypothetical protein
MPAAFWYARLTYVISDAQLVAAITSARGQDMCHKDPQVYDMISEVRSKPALKANGNDWWFHGNNQVFAADISLSSAPLKWS